MMRGILYATLVAMVVSGPIHGQEPAKKADRGPDKTTGSELMKKKLEHSKKLLEGLTINDFDMVIKNSEELMLISQKAEFLATKTREYEVQTNDFRRALQNMIRKSKDKNLDGATLAYLDMAMACVRCHQGAREVKIGLLDLPHSDATVTRK